MPKIFIAAILAFQFAAGAWTIAVAQSAPPPVTLSASELHEFRTNDGTLYDVYVAFPSGYEPNGDAEYPVLYVTDASATLAWFAQTARLLQLSAEIQPLIFVGVDWRTSSFAELVATRTLRFTPTRDIEVEQARSEQTGSEVRTGGADAFLATLTEEIIPWVEARYPVSGERGLFGASSGGLFATHALFTSSKAFTHYLILSPGLSWDKGAIFEREEAYANTHDDLPARVFMVAGSEEDPLGTVVSGVLKMSGTLMSRDYPSLEIDRLILTDETHHSVTGAAISRGLRFLFGPVERTSTESGDEQR